MTELSLLKVYLFHLRRSHREVFQSIMFLILHENLTFLVVKTLLMEFDHEIYSMLILSLHLIQEEQLSVRSERMCTILVNRLEDSLPSKSVVR